MTPLTTVAVAVAVAVAALVLTTAPCAHATVNRFSSTPLANIHTGLRFSKLKAADVTNDGRVDAVGVVGRRVSVSTNTGGAAAASSSTGYDIKATWTPFTVVSLDPNTAKGDAQGVGLGDIDGDGWIDVVLGYPATGQIVAAVNGKTTEAYSWQLWDVVELGVGSLNYLDLALADVDGAGGPVDIVVAAGRQMVVVFLALDPAGSSWTRRNVSDASGIYSLPGPRIAVADMDGDGFLDVMVGHALHTTTLSNAAADILWWRNVGGSASVWSTAHVVLDADSANIKDVKAADLDGDGDNDCVFAAGDMVGWLENQDGGGTVWSTRFDMVSGTQTQPGGIEGDVWAIDVGDVDGDGDVDVVSAARSSNVIGWMINPSGTSSVTGGWPTMTVTSALLDPETVVLSDTVGDGSLDVLTYDSFNRDMLWMPQVPSAQTSVVTAATSSVTINEPFVLRLALAFAGTPRTAFPTAFPTDAIEVLPSDVGSTAVVQPTSTPGTLALTLSMANPGTTQVSVLLLGKEVSGSPLFVEARPVCRPGTVVEAETTCAVCAVGTFDPTGLSEATDCETCPPRTTTRATQSTALANCTCVPGAWTPTGEPGVACEPCPSGGLCTGGTARPTPLPGYAVRPGAGVSFVACDSAGCVGGSECAPGYTGLGCARCVLGSSVRVSHSVCKACPSWRTGALIGWLIAMCVAGCGAGVCARAHNSPWARVAARVIIPGVQLMGVVAVDGQWGWTSAESSTVTVASLVLVDAERTAGASCALESLVGSHILSLAVALALAGGAAAASGLSLGGAGAALAMTFVPLVRSSGLVFQCVESAASGARLVAASGEECGSSGWWAAAVVAGLTLVVALGGVIATAVVGSQLSLALAYAAVAVLVAAVLATESVPAITVGASLVWALAMCMWSLSNAAPLVRPDLNAAAVRMTSVLACTAFICGLAFNGASEPAVIIGLVLVYLGAVGGGALSLWAAQDVFKGDDGSGDDPRAGMERSETLSMAMTTL